MTWRRVASDPTSPEALADRTQAISDALTHDPRPRLEMILDACRGRRVLDIGCVDHDENLVASEHWLHAKIAAVASSCVGVDNHVAGVERMNEQGFHAVACDIGRTPPPELVTEKFDVVIAGEVIEHLETPISLMRFSAQVLQPNGRLIATTPNPFCPWRARAGQLGIVWENADHLVYIFPSGVCEMAGRTGFSVERISSEGQPDNTRTAAISARTLAKGVARRLTGRLGAQPRVNRLGVPLPRTYLGPPELALFRTRARFGQSGERMIYQLVLNADGGVEPGSGPAPELV